MHKFFSPKSIAVIGASYDSKKVGHIVVSNLLKQGYGGRLFLVNPKGGRLFDHKVYKSFSEIKHSVDLVVFAVSSDLVIKLLPEIVRSGVKNFVIYAAGFKEVGDLQKEQVIKDLSEKNSLLILGPNCIGFVNTVDKINLTFLKGRVKSGNIGMVSQSGAIGSWLVDYFADHYNLGFSYFISVGNQTVIDTAKSLRFLADDIKTKVIACYLEGVVDGGEFRSALSYAVTKKPVIILKSGKTEKGAEAVSSHTGSLVGSDSVFQALFDQLGVIRAESLSEFLFLLKLFSYERQPKSENLMVITNGGGVGVLLTDDLISEGVNLVYLSKETVHKLKTGFNLKRVSIHNPLDILGTANADDFKLAIESGLLDSSVGAVVVLLTPQANTEIVQTARVVVKQQKKSNVPILPIFLGGKSVDKSLDLFEKHKIVGLSDFSCLPSSLKKVFNWQRCLKKDYSLLLKNLIQTESYKTIKIDFKQDNCLSKALGFLLKNNFPVLDFAVVSNEKQLVSAMKKLSAPYVIKADLESSLHKTDKQAVRVAVDSKDLVEAFYDLKNKGFERLVLQSFCKGAEFFIGLKQDPNFGVVLALGLGGVYVETLKSFISLVHPFDFFDFKRALKSAEFYNILSGQRGLVKTDLFSLYNLISRITKLVVDNNVKELDLNPVIFQKDKFFIADARFVFK
ncbi:MAG: hypothetical protein KatS3mg090_0129 [Patescibacteria group bacterium]|nr:MAG: hypothetical protein KatS3mg090_0129 [Patescibacteria group bacterium]